MTYQPSPETFVGLRPLAAYQMLTPPNIVFGWGRRREVGGLARMLGQRAFLVCGSKTLRQSGLVDELAASLHSAGVELVDQIEVTGEPEVRHVDAAAEVLRRHGAGKGDLVVGLGGGSALDMAKAVAALATNRHAASVADYLEGVGTGVQVTQMPLPVLAIPTTSGTGSEATKNAVISSFDPPYKKSFRSDYMLPRVVLIDPEFTVGLPPTVTAHTGMDAITQCVESYLSCRAQPIPRALALDGFRYAIAALPTAVREPGSRWAREAMAHAALLSGMALANSGLGMAHGVAAALGIQCRVPHGLACAVMLPATLRANRVVAEGDLAQLVLAISTGSPSSDAEAADALIRCVEQLCAEVGIPRRLRDLGVKPGDIPAIVQASRGNSMSGNPRPIPDDELMQILESML